MATIYILHDYSPSSAWLHSAIRSTFEGNHCKKTAIGYFSQWTNEPIKTHNTLWSDQYYQALPPWETLKQCEVIRNTLSNGKSVVLYGEPVRKTQIEFFLNLCNRYIETSTHDFSILFVLSHPSVILENHMRQAWPFGIQSNQVYYKQLLNFTDIIHFYKEMLPNIRINFIVNSEQCSGISPSNTLVTSIGDWLKQNVIVSSLPWRHPGKYKSHLSRRISNLIEVRCNYWPSLDEHNLNACFTELDACYPEDMISPLSMRQELEKCGLARQIEKACNLREGSLVASKPILEGKETDSSVPLPLAEFASLLSADNRKRLAERFRKDYFLTGPNQKRLLEEIESLDGNFAAIAVKDQEPLVTVLTMTYNQEKYIAQCMDSVLAQRTKFPVRHLVLDHHSSDSTPKIVAEYASRHPSIQPVLLSARLEHENVRGLCLRCKSKYAIFCDGDDYFIDPNKLQIQVDYLEQHPELSFCFHPVAAVFEDGSPPRIFPGLKPISKRRNHIFELADLASGNFIQTNSVLYRWRFREGLPDWFRADICLTDWYIHMLHAETGNFGLIPRIMSAYRRHAGAMFAECTQSTTALRRKMGIPELVAIEACLSHMDIKLHPKLYKLGESVIKDLQKVASDDGDETVLNFIALRFANSFCNPH